MLTRTLPTKKFRMAHLCVGARAPMHATQCFLHEMFTLANSHDHRQHRPYQSVSVFTHKHAALCCSHVHVCVQLYCENIRHENRSQHTYTSSCPILRTSFECKTAHAHQRRPKFVLIFRHPHTRTLSRAT